MYRVSDYLPLLVAFVFGLGGGLRFWLFEGALGVLVTLVLLSLC